MEVTELETDLQQANINYLKDNYWFCLTVGILAVGDRERLEQIERQTDEIL
jgi:hypothetical protein